MPSNLSTEPTPEQHLEKLGWRVSLAMLTGIISGAARAIVTWAIEHLLCSS